MHKGMLRRRWKTRSKENHWLDASYYSDVAANMRGVRVLAQNIQIPLKRSALISGGISRPDGRSFI